MVAGFTISASVSFAHHSDTDVPHNGSERQRGEEVRAARIAAFVVGLVSIVTLAFAMPAWANLPWLLFLAADQHFGAVWGLGGTASPLDAGTGTFSAR